ncbi:nitric oxide reductase NorD protein [Paracoccus halophilus]|uniref:Nitric oxide reductase D protein n=1 Tax=Paracoccus halophilus TaxID=376733 RepID=A0A099F568_9RHOB|nr:nitric oxide reductase D protein [Paracoccus halophilus]KGJ05418.1 nitric oxide reductase D protein [Paracoccus halophilus]SFA49119.1 nitric oxide reductase NorD protein [Paracoccus halophilus]
MHLELEPWEPEETVGKLWHVWASGFDAPRDFADQSVTLAEVSARLAVLFRGLGGAPSVEIRPASAQVSRHRISWRRKLGTEAETVPSARFDGEILRLPESLSVLPTRQANGTLYLWLAACAAHEARPDRQTDPLARDLARIGAARRAAQATLDDAPGLRGLYRDLCALTLQLRPQGGLPPFEANVEAIIRHSLGDPAPLSPLSREWLAMLDAPQVTAPRGYQPMRPVPLWPDFTRPDETDPAASGEQPDGIAADHADPRMFRARRRKSDQAERRDSLILHKFEALLSWADLMNLNRHVDDDDQDDAKKAAEDQEELGLGQVSKAPATRLRLHLDLAPEDADLEAVAGIHTYPEWDARRGRYLADHVRVLENRAAEDADAEMIHDAAAQRRIRAVRRQFEALRPGRITTTGHRDGEELDADLVVRNAAELRATGQGSDRIWRQSRPMARNLAVSILLDVSRSTESAVTGRAVIDIEREALAALAWGLDACGDSFAINAFSSLKRDRVFLSACKSFDEPMTRAVERRIAGLRPRFYTRLGAGIRHASAGLSAQASHRRLLLIVTDGKPNDLDHYEGRHGIEDSARAVREARMRGHAVHAVTVDRDGKTWFPRIFGQGGFSLIPHPDHLLAALPAIYRQLVGT